MKDQPTPQPAETVEQAAGHAACLSANEQNYDGIVEAIAYTKGFIAGAQWHARQGWVNEAQAVVLLARSRSLLKSLIDENFVTDRPKVIINDLIKDITELIEPLHENPKGD